MRTGAYTLLLTLGACSVTGFLAPTGRSREVSSPRTSSSTSKLRATDDDTGEPNEDSLNDTIDNIIAESTVRIDDGGSDLTDRFKYKVNALMGVFDPANGDDTEQASGNILNAMLKFPVRYTFNAVGKTETPDEFVEAVKNIVQQASGDTELVVSVKPRGAKFTKVSIEAQVDSAAIITGIYTQLEEMEQCVMQF